MLALRCPQPTMLLSSKSQARATPERYPTLNSISFCAIRPVARDGRAGFERSFFEEHVREKYGTYSWLFEAVLAKVGFEARNVWFSETQAHARYTCVKPA